MEHQIGLDRAGQRDSHRLDRDVVAELDRDSAKALDKFGHLT